MSLCLNKLNFAFVNVNCQCGVMVIRTSMMVVGLNRVQNTMEY